MNAVKSYNFFYALANNNLNGTKYIREILNKYSLFGFVIYDPVIHKEITEFFNNEYEEIDRTSGSKFLFFAVVDFDNEKLENFKDRPLYKTFNKKAISHPVITKNIDTTAFSLATHLEIDLKKLPVIIISNNIKFGDFTVIPTNRQSIESQLINLGRIAKEIIKYNKPFNFDNLLIDRGIENFENISNDKVNLNKALYDVIELYSISNTNNVNEIEPKFKFQTLNHINHTKSDLWCNIKNYKERNEEELINKELLKLVSVYTASNQYKPESYNILRNWHSSTTQMYLKNYEILLSSNILSDLEDDFSPIAICLTKAFENEIVLSYFNWMRKILGVPMPEFYDKPSKLADLKVTPQLDGIFNSQPIDLNMNRKGELLPPGLGQILLCLKYIIKSKNIIPESHSNEEIQLIIENWNIISKIRNKISHIDPLNISDYNILEQKIELVFNDPLGIKISELKNYLIN